MDIKPTQAQIIGRLMGLRDMYVPQQEAYRVCDEAIAALTAAAQVGEPQITRCTICGFVVDLRYEAEKPTVSFTGAGRSMKGTKRDAATIERCAQWLNNEAKAIRTGVSGGDGSEVGWIRADALDEAAAAIRKLKDEPKSS